MSNEKLLQAQYALSKQIPSIHTISTDYGDLPELTPDELARVRELLTTIFNERKCSMGSDYV